MITSREVIATLFKSAGLAAVRLTWGRLIDKREALYYLLGWALGRGLLPVTDRPDGAAGILGDKYWKWADAYKTELADQKKASWQGQEQAFCCRPRVLMPSLIYPSHTPSAPSRWLWMACLVLVESRTRLSSTALDVDLLKRSRSGRL